MTPWSAWWSVINARGQFIQQPLMGFDSPKAAMDSAEYRMRQQFAAWGQSQSLTRWQHCALPSGAGYQELLRQLAIDAVPLSLHPTGWSLKQSIMLRKFAESACMGND